MNRHLPDMYYLEGIHGVVFKTPLSALRWWSIEKGIASKPPQIGIVEVVYYGSNLRSDMKTTEDLINEFV